MAICACICHRHGSSGPHIRPAVDDPLETLLACRSCRDQHYPPAPPDFPPIGSADGYPFSPTDGEGAE